MLLETTASDRERALSAVREALVETQDMFGLLEARAVDWDVAVAELRYELTHGARAAGLDVEVTASGSGGPIAPAVRHAILRIAREALTNTIRHADARRISGDLRVDDTLLHLELCDDGHAFGAKPRGRGLAIIERRAEQLGGTATFRDDAGARIRVSIPLDSASSAR
jgi:signal transduction histidine kinase